MLEDVKYIELKSGYSDDGPAWIGKVKSSKTGKTIYFNGHAFQKQVGYNYNYFDIETDDEYWISGLKKNECNRHWAGHGKVTIDRRYVNEYLQYIGEKELNKTNYIVADIKDDFPVERIQQLLNEKS